MKKKVLSVLLSTAMITSLLVGCGGGGSGSQSAPAADGGSTEAPAEDRSSGSRLRVKRRGGRDYMDVLG